MTPSELAEISQDVFCQKCRYNLKGLTSDRCPECGRSVGSIRSPVPQIPWVHRKRIGRISAYWRTVCLVMFRQARFCEEMARPVSYADAQRFRWVTIAHAYLPILLATVLVYLINPPEMPTLYTPQQQFQQMATTGTPHPAPSLLDWAYVEVWPVAVLHVCFLLMLAAVTGVPSYFFHPRRLSLQVQNRTVALSYYANAALAWTPVPMALGMVGWWWMEYVYAYAAHAWTPIPIAPGMVGWSWLEAGKVTGAGPTLFAFSLLAVVLAAWWFDYVHLARRTISQHGWHSTFVAVCLPLLWLLLAGLILVGLPFLVLLVLVVIASLV